MPKKKKPTVPTEAAPAVPELPKELLDQLITGPITQGEFEMIYRALKKAIIERAMSTEMTEHLGYKHVEPKPTGQTNQRNGTSGTTVLTDDGPVDIDVPRDREGGYELLIIGKHERRFTGFDQKIIAMYARGMTVRKIQGPRCTAPRSRPTSLARSPRGKAGRSSRCTQSCSSMRCA